VRALVAAGHEVTAAVRSPAKAEYARSLGATAVEVSIFDAEALRAAVFGHDAVCNLATHIPSLARAADPHAWDENTRIRTEGSRNLVDAALAANASVYVQESIAFLYGDHRGEWLDAESNAITDTRFSTPIRACESETKRFADAGGTGVVLRFGLFMAPDSEQMLTMARNARRGLSVYPGAADAYLPSIHADDAAAAVVAALRAPSGTYDVVDDVPSTRGDQRAALAAAVGRRRLIQLRAPKAVVGPLGDSQRVSNRRFREATSWAPRYPSAREAWPATVRAAGIEPALSGWVRLLLWLMAFGSVGVALQALFTPRSFYDDFPLGRGWVHIDGPYNQHLVRDVGSLNLALVVLVLAALFVSTRLLATVAAVVYLVNAIPHFAYHARHINMNGMEASDRVGILVTLGGAVVMPLLVLLLVRSRRPTVVT
jgi:nucleoside-diphosphate-sugar epimerase